MRERIVAVIGAGNMRCAPSVAAALATWRPDDLVDVRLFDANWERLDLVDRLLREAMDRAGTEHSVVSTTDLDEALERATDVILTLHEDCARRMAGSMEAHLYVPEEPEKLEHQVRGDPNKPTHPERLSNLTHAILSSPGLGEASRADAIAAAAAIAGKKIPPGAAVISLMREVASTYETLDWPAPLEPADLACAPHQILRWINGEVSFSALLQEAPGFPVSRWLDRARP